MKKHLYGIIVAALFSVGLSVLLYPAFSAYVNEKHASRLVAGYNDRISSTSDAELDRLFEAAEAYNERLQKKPGSFYNPSAVSGYRDVLDITGTGIMGYVTIPKIKVELPLYHGIDEGVLQIGAGHLEGSDLPIGGESVHSVLSGHRGLPSAKLFTDLDQLGIGDRFTVTVLNRVLTYEIDQVKIVKPSESEDLLRKKGHDYCTLLTCTPYGINSHRMLVRGIRVPDPDTVQKAGVHVANEAFRIHTLLVASFVGAPTMLILMLLLLLQYSRQKQADHGQKGGKPQECTESKKNTPQP